MPKRLLVLGAGAAQVGLLAAARREGLFVIAVDRDPDAPGFRYADRRAILSAEDEQGIERLAAAERIDGIIAPGIDWPVAIAARVASRLAIPHPLPPDTAALATSKLQQRQVLARAGVPQPRWRLTTSADDVTTFPCVVKAPDRQGQRGLTLVQTPPALADAIRDAVAASRGGSCLVEQLIDGPELTVNGFSVDGAFHTLTLTDRLTAEPPAFGVALAHVWPSFLSADVVAAVAETAGRAVTALGIESGPSYTQLRVGPEGPAVIEVAARLGGGHDAELCEATLGVELNRLALAAALGEEVTTVDLRAEARAGGGCTRFLVPSQGELRRVEGVEAARIAAGVVAVYIYRSPGHRFGPLRLGADRAGAVLATGASRAEAVERADRAADLIRFDAVDAGTEAFVER